MITAIDSNILLDIIRPNEDFYDAAVRAMENGLATGSLVICDVVYAEVSVHFTSQTECDAFLEDASIRVEPLGREASFRAGRAWRAYRRRGGKRDRILPDFLVGAHAEVQASQFITRDRRFYSDSFPALKIVDPSQG